MLYATRAVVDLDAITQNMRGIRDHVEGRKVLAAVKANAYGHEAVPVSRHMERLGLADFLGVATVPEGIELREGGVRLPILKLSHCIAGDELDAAVAHDITPTVVDAQTIDAVAAAGGHKVHLKLDTGMRRIGADPHEAVELARRIDEAGLELEGIFTHLPVSDSPAGDDFTRQQLSTFRSTAQAVAEARGEVPLVHASNSGAVLGHELDGLTMVRPGVIVYGYHPDDECVRSITLHPAMELHSQVSFVKRVEAGQSVGYGRTWIAPQETWVATVPVGYADGYSRRMSNRGRMVIDGRAYPVVGRVCMDQAMIDLGPGPTRVRTGDNVVVLGAEDAGGMGIEEAARVMDTIPYEVTCLISARATREHRDVEPRGEVEPTGGTESTSEVETVSDAG